MNSKSYMSLSELSLIVPKLQLWRLFTNHLFFSYPQELLFGLFLIYHFRVFERQMGSAKFGVGEIPIDIKFFRPLRFSRSWFLQFLNCLCTWSFQPWKTRLLDRKFTGFISMTSGYRYSFIFACFVLYFFDVPPTYRFSLCGIRSNDKLFTYILGLQVRFYCSCANIDSCYCPICIIRFSPGCVESWGV
jgi:hypothetical protein